MANTVTLKEVYELVDSMRREFKHDNENTHAAIRRVEDKFDTMEAGRLSKLEREFATMQGKLMAGMFAFGVALQTLFFVAQKFFK